MSDSPGSGLADTLGIRQGMVVAVLNVPNYMNIDLEVPSGVDVHRTESAADLYLVFADRISDAERVTQRVVARRLPDPVVWILWPVDAPEDDISSSGLDDVLSLLGLTLDRTVTVDGVWEAAKFKVGSENYQR